MVQCRPLFDRRHATGQLVFLIYVICHCFSQADSMPTLNYEFPHGYNQDFGNERFKVCEGLFDPSFIKVSNV